MRVETANELPPAAATPVSRARRVAPVDKLLDLQPHPGLAHEENVDKVVAAANLSMQSVATNLKFEKDSSSGKTVVRVIDSETQQVLRQMPSEEMLAMSNALDRLQGLIVHLKV